MDLFANYEQDFVDTINNLQNLIQNMPNFTAGTLTTTKIINLKTNMLSKTKG